MLIEIRGTRLYVDQRGAADAPALLFLHGGPGAGSYDFMSFQGDRLGRRLRLIGVDQRGVQQSDPLTGEVTEHDLIADFEALREELGLETWSILGHSYGGRLALRYAVMHPDRVTKVIFENPAWDMVLATDTLLKAALPLLPGVEFPAHTGPATSPEEISCFQSDVLGGAYHFAPGTGHFLHAEARADYAGLVTEFVLR